MDALAKRVRDPLPELLALRIAGAIRSVEGDLEGALDICQRLVALGDEVGQPGSARTYAFLTAVRPLLLLGRGQEILSQLETFPRMSAAWRALVDAQNGREEVSAALTGMMESVRGPEGEEASADLLGRLLEIGLELGNRDVVSELVGRLSTMSGMSRDHYGNTCPARHLGAAAALLGKPEDARGYYAQALEAAGKIRFRPEIALTRLQLAELLLEHYPEERGEALEHLDFAIEEFRAMKMQPSLERALRHKGLLKA